MSSLWDSIQSKSKAATSIVNEDLIAVEDPVRGAPIRAPSSRAEFKPLNPAVVEIVTHPDGQETAIIKPIVYKPDEAKRLAQRSEKKPVSNPTPPRDDFLDLIMDDPPPSSAMPSAGRPRLYNSNAERQQAYRDRKKAAQRGW